MLRRIKHHFKLINKCQDFTEADRLKSRPNTLNTSLRRTRKNMEKNLSEAFGRAANSKRFTAPILGN